MTFLRPGPGTLLPTSSFLTLYLLGTWAILIRTQSLLFYPTLEGSCLSAGCEREKDKQLLPSLSVLELWR